MESAFVEKLLESLLWGYVCSVCRDVGLLAGNHGTVDKVRKGELSSLLSSLILLEASLSEIEIRTNGRSKDANNKLLIFSMNKGKNGVLEMCKIKFYISHISSTTVLDPKLGYRK